MPEDQNNGGAKPTAPAKPNPTLEAAKRRYPNGMALALNVATIRLMKRADAYVHHLAGSDEYPVGELIDLLASNAFHGILREEAGCLLFLLDGNRLLAVAESYAGTDELIALLDKHAHVKPEDRMRTLRSTRPQVMEYLEALVDRARRESCVEAALPTMPSFRRQIVETIAVAPYRLTFETDRRAVVACRPPESVFIQTLLGDWHAYQAYTRPPEPPPPSLNRTVQA